MELEEGDVILCTVERIVGTVEYNFSKDSLHFIALATHPEYVRQGIAKTLVAKLEEIGSSDFFIGFIFILIFGSTF